MNRQTLRQNGAATSQKLFGSSGQTKGLANLLTEPVFGGVWNRPGLALCDRLLCTIAALAIGPRMRSLRQWPASYTLCSCLLSCLPRHVARWVPPVVPSALLRLAECGK